jgi:hypothetical protein
MSRKSIQISLPAASVAPAEAPAGQNIGAERGGAGGVDSWIAQAQDAPRTIAEEAFSRTLTGEGLTIKIRLSPEPDWAEAAKIFFLLPQAALWFWTFGLARKAMRSTPVGRR